MGPGRAGVTAKGHCPRMVFYSRNKWDQNPAVPQLLIHTLSEHRSGLLLCLCFHRGFPWLEGPRFSRGSPPSRGSQACRSLQLYPSIQWTVKWSWQARRLRAEKRANGVSIRRENSPICTTTWKCHSDRSAKCSGGKGNIMTETIWHPI